MALTSIPLRELTEEHLRRLIADEVGEGRGLEYKLVVGGGDETRREFLADVSSFANAAGGDLLVGVDATDGIATALAGVVRGEVDGELQRLENMLRDGVEPRIPGIALHAVALADARAVIVIRVPRSWSAPHMVTFKGLSRFYSRNSSGKYPLDVAEIRSAFVASASARSAVRTFRIERLARIAAGETPVSLIDAPKVVLHLIPLTVGDTTVSVDLSPLHHGRHASLRPMRSSARGWSPRVNFDGVLCYETGANGEPPWSYLQVFRSGAIEGVDPFILRQRAGFERQIPSKALEGVLINGLGQALTLTRDLGVPAPVVCAVSLLGVRDFEMMMDPRRYTSGETIDREDLLVPEMLVEDLSQSPASLLQPQLDAIWNAAGYSGSPNFTEDGEWQPEN
jgi:hypothetical protein